MKEREPAPAMSDTAASSFLPRKALLLGLTLLAGAAAPLAQAQTIEPTGVISTYYPGFIDRLRAQTALEMIRRLPNFIYDAVGE